MLSDAIAAPARVAILGAAGRMGRLLITATHEAADLVLAAATVRPGSSAIGQDAGILAGAREPIGVVTVDSADSALAVADVAVDFSNTSAVRAHVTTAAARGVAILIGTTGLDEADHAAVRSAAAVIPVVLAPNTSLGVALLCRLVEQAAAVLDLSFDVEITETHHRAKLDAPSGTALALAEAAARGRGQVWPQVRLPVHGTQASPRPKGGVGISSIRGGDVAGEHTVHFLGSGERIALCHIAGDRRLFAQGAVRAMRWLAARPPPGLYGMKDVLGL